MNKSLLFFRLTYRIQSYCVNLQRFLQLATGKQWSKLHTPKLHTSWVTLTMTCSKKNPQRQRKHGGQRFKNFGMTSVFYAFCTNLININRYILDISLQILSSWIVTKNTTAFLLKRIKFVKILFSTAILYHAN